MRFLNKLFKHLQPKKSQRYNDDKRYIYRLIYVGADGVNYSRTFSTSCPLEAGHRIVLDQDYATLVVVHIAHLIYSEVTEKALQRDTIFVHAGIIPAPENNKLLDLNMLGFKPYLGKVHLTVH